MRFLDFQLDDAIANAGGTTIYVKYIDRVGSDGYTGISTSEYHIISLAPGMENWYPETNKELYFIRYNGYYMVTPYACLYIFYIRV